MIKKEILIVEDSAVMAEAIQAIVENLGYGVTAVVASGEEAILSVERSQPALVLMDINLAGKMDGITAAEQVHGCYDIPIIFLTAVDDKETLQRAKSSEPFGYILKPFQGKELQTAIEIALYKHQMEKALRESEKRYRAIVEDQTELICRFTPDFKLTFVNEAYCRYYGKSREELIGFGFLELNPADLSDALQDHMALFTPGHEIASMEHASVNSRGELRWQHWTNRAFFDDRGHVVEFQSVGWEITERKQAEDALRESQHLQERIVNTIPDILYIYDLNEKRNVYTNRPLGLALGYTPEQIEAMGSSFVQQVLHPNDQVHLPALMKQLMAAADGEIIETEYQLKQADGQWRWFHARKTIFNRDEEGIPRQILGTVLDINARKRAQAALGESEAKLKAIYQLGQELTLWRDKSAIIWRVLETATQLLKFEVATCGLVDPVANELEYYCGLVNGRQESPQLRLSLAGEQGIAVAVVRSGQTINVADTRHDARYVAISNWLGLSELCVPMKVDGRVIGMLNAESKNLAHFTPADEQLLEALANQTAVALENARLYEEVQRRARELSMINKASRALASTLDLGTVLEQAMVEVRNLLQVEGASLLLCDAEREELVFSAVASPSANALLGVRLPVTSGIAGWVVRERASLIVTDSQNDARFYGRIDDITGLTTGSLLAVPLLNAGQAIGVIELINKAEGVFNSHDLEMLEALAASVVIAIENARLYEAEREQYRRLQQSQAQLIQSAKMAALGRLVASLAHEINNPIQSVQGCLTLAREELDEEAHPDKLNRYLGIVESEIDRIATIVRRMRDFYRPARQEMQPTQLKEIITTVLDLTLKQLQQGGIRLEQTWPDELPDIEANPDHLKQVFLNLVLNAIDAMPTGGTLSFVVMVDHIKSTRAEYLHPAIRVEVSDSGEGISPESLPNLFEPFYTTKTDGTGLGLSISYSIIKAHQGEILATSRPEKGAIFTIRLPVKQ